MSDAEEPRNINDITLITPSGRFRLEPPLAKYDAELAILRSHPEARKYLPYLPEHLTTEEARNWRREKTKIESNMNLHILLCDGDSEPKFIGQTGIFKIDTVNRSASVGICLHPDYFRTGVGTEVLYTVMKYGFEESPHQFHRLTYETSGTNVMMRGWLEKVAGIKHEFTLREAWVIRDGGGWVDCVGYTLFEQDWYGEVKGRLEERMNRSLKA